MTREARPTSVTPRTAAGRALLDGLQTLWPYEIAQLILAIEVEAAAEPAAAEPPDLRAALTNLLGAVAQFLDEYESEDGSPYEDELRDMVENAVTALTAQPPRGSLPDTELHGGYQMAAAVELAGNSLTATEPPDWKEAAVRAYRRGLRDGRDGYPESWPLPDDFAASLQESGSPRGVTPALDERVLREVMLDSGATMDYANYVAKQYAARLGSPEDSE